jgi:Protein of unknown function (DUF3592)
MLDPPHATSLNGLSNTLEKIAGVVILLGILFGLLLVLVIPYEMFRKADAENWSSSRKGVITQSYANRRVDVSAGRRGVSWRSEICGTYQDNGERFCVSHVSYGDFGWEARAREVVAKYPVGREVDVYYSPDNPKETILEPVSPWTQIFTFLGLGIGFLLLPVVLWAFRKKIEPNRYGRG